MSYNNNSYVIWKNKPKIRMDTQDSGTCDHLEERIVVVDAATNTQQSLNNNVQFADQPDLLTSTTHQSILPAHSSMPNYDASSIGERFREGCWPQPRFSSANLATYSQIETCSLASFRTSGSGQDVLHEAPTAQHLSKKLGMMYSLLEMFRDVDNISQKLRTMSLLPEECIIMRQSGYIPLLVHLIYTDNDSSRSSIEARNHASAALRNIVSSNSNSEQAKREVQVLRLLDRVRAHCDKVRLQLASGNSLQEDCDINYRPGEAATWLKDKSFKEEYQPVICLLGGLQALADLIDLDNTLHACTEDPYHLNLRAHACMALTNLTFRRGANKSLLCSMKPTMLALVEQLKSSNESLQRASASVLRNLSWHADLTSKQTLREIRAVPLLMKAAMQVGCESTLKQILSALWNLSSHCHENKVDICKIDGALGFLVGLLTFKSVNLELAINESSGGILMNVSNLISENETFRQILRHRNCLQILVKQLTSESLTIVGNACYTLWNLSARCEQDQKALFVLKADELLERLTQSKHEKIREGSSGALKNLRKLQPKKTFPCAAPSSRPSLLARKQKQLTEELDLSLQETCDNIESPTISPTEMRRNVNNYFRLIKEPELHSFSYTSGADDEPLVERLSPATSENGSAPPANPGKVRKKRLVYVEPNYIPVMPISRKVDLDDSYDDEPIDYSKQYSEKMDEPDDQPIDCRTRYKEPDAVVMPESMPQDTVKTFHTEDTPCISKANSLTDLPQAAAASLCNAAKPSRMVQSCGTVVLSSRNVNQPSPPQKPASSSGELTSSLYSYHDSSQTDSPSDKVIPYATEDTPINFTRVSSLSSLNCADEKKTDESFQSCTATAGSNSAHNSSGSQNSGAKSVTWDPNIQSPIMFSRCTSLGSLSSFDASSLHSEVTSEHSSIRVSGITSPSDVPESASACPSPPSSRETPSPPGASFMNHAGDLTTIEMTISANEQNLKLDMIGNSTLDEMQHYAIENSPVTFSSNTSLSALSIDSNPKISMELKTKRDVEARMHDGEEDELKSYALEDIPDDSSCITHLSALGIDPRDQMPSSLSIALDEKMSEEENAMLDKIIKDNMPKRKSSRKNIIPERIPDGCTAPGTPQQSKLFAPQSTIFPQPSARIAISGSWLSTESKRFAVSTPKNAAMAQRALHYNEILEDDEEQPKTYADEGSPYSLTRQSPVQFLDRVSKGEDNMDDGFRLLEEDDFDGLGLEEIPPYQQNYRFIEELEISPSVDVEDVHCTEDEMLHFSVEGTPASLSAHSSLSELSVESLTPSEKDSLAQFIRSALPKKSMSGRKNKISIPRSTLCNAPDVSPENSPQVQRNLNANNIQRSMEIAEINANWAQKKNPMEKENKENKLDENIGQTGAAQKLKQSLNNELSGHRVMKAGYEGSSRLKSMHPLRKAFNEGASVLSQKDFTECGNKKVVQEVVTHRMAMDGREMDRGERLGREMDRRERFGREMDGGDMDRGERFGREMDGGERSQREMDGGEMDRGERFGREMDGRERGGGVGMEREDRVEMDGEDRVEMDGEGRVEMDGEGRVEMDGEELEDEAEKIFQPQYDGASDDGASDDGVSDDRASDDRASDDRASDDRASGDRASGDRASGDRASDVEEIETHIATEALPSGGPRIIKPTDGKVALTPAEVEVVGIRGSRKSLTGRISQLSKAGHRTIPSSRGAAAEFASSTSSCRSTVSSKLQSCKQMTLGHMKPAVSNSKAPKSSTVTKSLAANTTQSTSLKLPVVHPVRSPTVSPVRSSSIHCANKALTVGSHKASTVNSPKSSTVSSPKSSTVSSPKSSTVSSPKSSTVSSPKSSTVSSPESSTVNSPKLSNKRTPKPSNVSSPKPSTVSSPKPSIVSSPKPSTVSSPKPSTVSSPKPSTVSSPKPSTVSSPKPSTVSSPKPSTVLSPKSSPMRSLKSSTDSPKSSNICAPRTSAVSSPRPATVSSPRSSAVSSPKSSAVSSPRSSAVRSPRSSAVSSPRSSAVRSPRSSEVSSPKPSTVRSPGSANIHGLESSCVKASKSSTLRLPDSSVPGSSKSLVVSSPKMNIKSTATSSSNSGGVRPLSPRLNSKISISSLRPPKILPPSTCKSRQAASFPKIPAPDSTVANVLPTSSKSASDACILLLSSTQSPSSSLAVNCSSSSILKSQIPTAKVDMAHSESNIPTLIKPVSKNAYQSSQNAASSKSTSSNKSQIPQAPSLIPKSSIPSQFETCNQRTTASSPMLVKQDVDAEVPSVISVPVSSKSFITTTQCPSSSSSILFVTSPSSLIPSFGSFDSACEVPELESANSETLSLKSESISVQSDAPSAPLSVDVVVVSSKTCSISAIDCKTKVSVKKHAVSRIASLWKKDVKKNEKAESAKSIDECGDHQEDKKNKRTSIFRVPKSRSKRSMKPPSTPPPDPPMQCQGLVEECTDFAMKRRTYTIDRDDLCDVVQEKNETEVWLGEDGTIESISSSRMKDAEKFGNFSLQEKSLDSSTPQPLTKTEMLLARRRQKDQDREGKHK